MAQIDSLDRTVVERQDPLVGSVLDGKYRIHERIAAGGFAAIYRATHMPSKHEFAIKILHPNLVSDQRVVSRFRREGAALAALKHEHTITAYELGQTPEGMLYIVMELLSGESLYERFRARGPLTWQATVALGKAICGSLGEAHALGMIHRDLKPANIHLERRGEVRDFVKVLDFGIVRVSDGNANAEIDSSELTQAGQVIGTFDYMSPEQMVGGVLDGRSDIYAVGVLMYEMISGVRPFAEAGSLTALLAAVLTGQAPALSSRIKVPAGLDRIVMRCLEREPQQRFADVSELAFALDQLTTVDEPVTRRVSTNAILPEICSSDDVTRIDRRLPRQRGPTPSPPNVVRRSVPVMASQATPARAQPRPTPSPPQTPPTPVRAPRPTPSPPEARQPRPTPSPPMPMPSPQAPRRDSMPPPERVSHATIDQVPQQPMWQVPPPGSLPTPMPVSAQARGSSTDIGSYPYGYPPQAPAQIEAQRARDLHPYPFDMEQARSRDLLMRRLVVGLSLALLFVVALVIASHV